MATKQMTLAQAVAKANGAGGRKDSDAIGVLRQHFGENAALWVANDKIDLVLSDKALSFLEDAQNGPRAEGGKYKSCLTVDEWLKSGKAKREADPITGVMLDDDGKSADASEVDWSGVDPKRRMLAAYATQQNKIGQGERERHAVAAELAQPTLTGMWLAVEAAVAQMTAAQREALEQRLYYVPFAKAAEPVRPPAAAAPQVVAQPAVAPGKLCAADSFDIDCDMRCNTRKCGEGVPGTIGKCGRPVLGPPVLAPPRAVHVGNNAYGMIVTGDGNNIGTGRRRSPYERMYLLFSKEDKAYAATLRKFTITLTDRQPMRGCDDVPPGSAVMAHLTSEIGGADIVVVLVTANLINDSVILGALDLAHRERKRIVPVICGATILPDWMARLRPLPERGRIKDDDDWCAVVAALQGLFSP